MFAKASEGMDRLYVFDPSGERRVYLKSSGKDDLGQGETLVESAEPSIEGVKRAFPQGRYLFVARTIGAECVFPGDPRGLSPAGHEGAAGTGDPAALWG